MQRQSPDAWITVAKTTTQRRARYLGPIIVSVPGRIRIAAVASEQFLQQMDISWLAQMRVETCGEAPLADVHARVASESDQIELRRRKPLTQIPREVNPVRPRQ